MLTFILQEGFFLFFFLHLLETRNLDIDKRLRDPASATRSL